jgi:hypothetical protein
MPLPAGRVVYAHPHLLSPFFKDGRHASAATQVCLFPIRLNPSGGKEITVLETLDQGGLKIVAFFI